MAGRHGPLRNVVDVSRLRFLLVEDQEFQRWVLENAVRELGTQAVFTATDGAGAIAVLQAPASFIDIVVTDLDMPGMDGLEFIRRLGESGWQGSLVVASGLDRALLASVEAMTEAYGVRLLGAIEKPVTPRKLAAAIERHGAAGPILEPVAQRFTALDVRRALRDEQVEVFYQPKVELGNGRVAGAEALVRWRHPERGILPAQDFIGAVTQAGLLRELTELVVRRATAACREWLALGIDASVAVNVSLDSAGEASLADWLMQIVQLQGLEPRRLVVEVTETAQAPHLGKAIEDLSRLRMRGFGLSIDDYGMGYSSMQQLMRIPFTELKIDRDFVHRATGPKNGRAALESSLELAAKLRIVAVAEGVETQPQWDLLRELGCGLAQGYLIAPAMSKDEFIAWSRTRATHG